MQPIIDDLTDEADMSEDAKDRASARRNYFLGTTLTFDGHGVLPARVRNLSGGGMMVDLAQEPVPEIARGERVVAELRNIGRVKGEIAWIGGRRFGIKFDRDIDPELARKPTGKADATPPYAKRLLAKDKLPRTTLLKRG